QDVVAALIARQQQAALEQRLSHFHPADIAFVLEGLPSELRKQAWELVRAERRGAVLLETAASVRSTLMHDLAPDEIAAVVRAMNTEDIADLVNSLPEELGQQVLARLDRVGQEEVSSVLSFPADTVGALMTRDAVAVRDDASLEAVLRLLRRRQKLPPHTTQLFVIDRGNVLKGLLPVSRLLVGEPESLVAEGMTAEPIFFYTDDPAREAVASFERYGLISAPVVNLHRQVVGRVTVDAVLDEMKQRSQSDSLRQVGLTEEEDLYAPVRKSARNRWPWLGVNLLTAFAASRVIGAFEEVIVQLVALAALMPIVASIGGNSGNQSVALVIRGLALNQLGPQQLRQMLLKELRIASINGALWGAAMGLATLILYGN
ncbi:MAG: magnesium transporter, partial [Hydrocarboniphaga effusa]|nr:magnesium transporter [Hydrocarboniphaga effusa]